MASIVPQIRLLNVKGRWKSPADLCFEEQTIIYEDIVDKVQEHILSSVPPIVAFQLEDVENLSSESTSDDAYIISEQEFQVSAQRLEAYFQPWDEKAALPQLPLEIYFLRPG